eukprot:3416735-Pleurochrysis_carterae.AAC.1
MRVATCTLSDLWLISCDAGADSQSRSPRRVQQQDSLAGLNRLCLPLDADSMLFSVKAIPRRRRWKMVDLQPFELTIKCKTNVRRYICRGHETITLICAQRRVRFVAA